MPLEFCEHDDVVFERAPLIAVLCQVKFPPILSLLTVAGIAGFQTGLRDVYPRLSPGQMGAELNVQAPQLGVQTSAPVWRLRDDEEQWTVGIAVDFVSLETATYTHIDDFLDRFRQILNVLRRTLRPADSQRIGMRKVNMFKVQGRDTAALRGMIRAELLGPLAVPVFPAPITANFSQLMFADEDNALVARYGLADEAEAKDEDVTKFVLDLDYFTERPHEVDGTDSLIDLLRHFSDGMTSFFHWAMEDEYKMNLAPRSRREVEGES